MQIIVDGLLTQYELTGKGPLLLLLHGWGDDSRTFAGLQRRLAARYQVLALDLPGFGGSQAPPAAWNLDDYGQFAAWSLAKLKLAQPYAVIGHSNGGALAIRAAALGLLKPQKLVLLAASGIRTGGGVRRLLLKSAAKTGKAATLWLPQRHRRALRRRLYGAAGSDELVVPALRETFRRIVRQDVQADAARLALPALLIYAQNDRATPPRYGRRYHELMKGSRLEIVAGAGHFVHLDQPAAVAGLIEEFLK